VWLPYLFPGARVPVFSWTTPVKLLLTLGWIKDITRNLWKLEISSLILPSMQ
jgi:hypothetical protein